MKRIRLTMVNENLRNCPIAPLPPGFRFRYFTDDDEEAWIKILTQAGEFPTVAMAQERFQNEFSSSFQRLQERAFFVETEQGKPVGTAMGWYNPAFRDGNYGRLHWVAIMPPYQGKGLARPLVTKALQIMKKEHTKAYLTTRPRSYKGIRLYLDYGFKPVRQTADCQEGWDLVAKILGIKILL